MTPGYAIAQNESLTAGHGGALEHSNSNDRETMSVDRKRLIHDSQVKSEPLLPVIEAQNVGIISYDFRVVIFRLELLRNVDLARSWPASGREYQGQHLSRA